MSSFDTHIFIEAYSPLAPWQLRSMTDGSDELAAYGLVCFELVGVGATGAHFYRATTKDVYENLLTDWLDEQLNGNWAATLDDVKVVTLYGSDYYNPRELLESAQRSRSDLEATLRDLHEDHDKGPWVPDAVRPGTFDRTVTRRCATRGCTMVESRLCDFRMSGGFFDQWVAELNKAGA